MASHDVACVDVAVSGIETHVYGLSALREAKVKSYDLIFLLHGRTGQFQDLEHWAEATLEHEHLPNRLHDRGLLIVAFDQRNHGHRKVSERANQAWADGNETHAQDMYSIQYGTSQDVSLLITFLPLILFPQSQYTLANVLCAGVSLGGHATYLALTHDPRISAGIIIIGCPSYTTLMTMRAAKSTAPKATLLPPSLLSTVSQLDPQLAPLCTKDLLILKGDDDELVPWAASEEFVGQLVRAGRAEVVGFPGVGHAFPLEMMERSVRWIGKWRARRVTAEMAT